MRHVLVALLSDSLSSVVFCVLACPVSSLVCSLRISMGRGTGQFEKSTVVSPDPCVVQGTCVELFWGTKVLYRAAQFRLRPSLHKGVSQIMPAGRVVQAPAVSGPLPKAKPHGLMQEGWGDHTVWAKGKEQARSLVKLRGKSPTNPPEIKTRYEFQRMHYTKVSMTARGSPMSGEMAPIISTHKT